MKYIKLYEDIESNTFNEFGKIVSSTYIIFSNKKTFQKNTMNELILFGRVIDFDGLTLNNPKSTDNVKIRILDYVQKYAISSYDINFDYVFSTADSITGDYFKILHISFDRDKIQNLFKVIVQEKEDQWEMEKNANKYNI